MGFREFLIGIYLIEAGASLFDQSKSDASKLFGLIFGIFMAFGCYYWLR